MKMKKYGLFITFVFLGFLIAPNCVYALDDSTEETTTSITSPALENSYIEVQAKSSGSKSSSSSKTKIKTKGDDDETTGEDTGTDIPWWIFLVIGGVILVIIAIIVWYLFLRK